MKAKDKKSDADCLRLDLDDCWVSVEAGRPTEVAVRKHLRLWVDQVRPGLPDDEADEIADDLMHRALDDACENAAAELHPTSHSGHPVEEILRDHICDAIASVKEEYVEECRGVEPAIASAEEAIQVPERAKQPAALVDGE